MSNKITTFKIRIDSIQEHAIGFELFAGEAVDDTYINIIKKGGYNVENRLLLTPKQFSDFANRLIGYVYTEKKSLTDEQLVVLWDLRLNIYDHEHPTLGSLLLKNHASRLQELSEKKQLEYEKRKEGRKNDS